MVRTVVNLTLHIDVAAVVIVTILVVLLYMCILDIHTHIGRLN